MLYMKFYKNLIVGSWEEEVLRFYTSQSGDLINNRNNPILTILKDVYVTILNFV